MGLAGQTKPLFALHHNNSVIVSLGVGLVVCTVAGSVSVITLASMFNY